MFTLILKMSSEREAEVGVVECAEVGYSEHHVVQDGPAQLRSCPWLHLGVGAYPVEI